jgi:hypothetical protein
VCACVCLPACLPGDSTANPLSCAAAAAVLQYIVDEQVVENAQAKGIYLQHKLEEALSDSPIVGDIRVRPQPPPPASCLALASCLPSACLLCTRVVYAWNLSCENLTLTCIALPSLAYHTCVRAHACVRMRVCDIYIGRRYVLGSGAR